MRFAQSMLYQNVQYLAASGKGLSTDNRDKNIFI